MKTLKQVLTEIVAQLQNSRKALFCLYLPIILLFLLIGVLSKVTSNVSLAFLLRDITATAKLAFYTGFVSQLGLMLWSASLTVCLFALFGTSIALDAVPKEALPPRYFWEQLELFLEDVIKFAGMATWLLYFARYTIQRIEGSHQNRDVASP